MKLGVVFGAATLVGFASGLAIRSVDSSTPIQVEEVWQARTPEDVRRDTRPALAAAKRTLRWSGRDETEGARGPAQVTWELAAVADSPAPIALFRSSGKPELLRLAIGDELPDGSRIDSIARDRVIVVQGECRRILQLFQPAEVEAGAACPDDTSPAN